MPLFRVDFLSLAALEWQMETGQEKSQWWIVVKNHKKHIYKCLEIKLSLFQLNTQTHPKTAVPDNSITELLISEIKFNP